MDSALALLLSYKYAVLLPLSVIEGPIITVIAGFLVTLGILNIFLVYIIAVAGDVVGDALLYALGRWGKGFLHAYGRHIGITEERLRYAKEFFELRHGKAIMTSKLAHGIGFTGLLTAGALGIPYIRYAKTCLTITVVQSAIMLLVGIFFGHAYLQIQRYMNDFAAIVSVAALVGIASFAAYRLIDFTAIKNKLLTKFEK